MNPKTALTTIKAFHTFVWAFFASCILAIPVTAHTGSFALSGILIALVLLEVLILVANQGSCPLTAVAARYTTDREANFDIFLPRWIAKYNKAIFGAIFVGGTAYSLYRWWQEGQAACLANPDALAAAGSPGQEACRSLPV